MVELHTDRLLIREMTEDDARFVVSIRNRTEVHKWFFRPKKITVEEHLTWFCNTRDDRLDFIIELKDKEEAVGIFNFKFENGPTVEHGKIISPEYAGKGIATEASIRLFKYAFTELGIEKIKSVTRSDNNANLGFLDKFGFESSKPFTAERHGNEMEVIESELTPDQFQNIDIS